MKAKVSIDKITQCSDAISVSSNPKKLERAYLRRGNAFMESNRFVEAIQDFTTTIRMNSHVAGYYDNRQSALKAMRRFSEAMRDAEAAVALAPKYPFVYRSRGLLRADMGTVGSAIDDFTMAISLDSRDSGLFVERGKLLVRQGRADDAIADFSHALELRPDALDAIRERGLAHKIAGHIGPAIADLFAHGRLHPEDREVANVLAELTTAQPPPSAKQAPEIGPQRSRERPERTISTGTGFFVSSGGHVVTNAHVVDGCSEVQIVEGLSRPVSGRVVARDVKNDLAIVLSEGKSSRIAVLRAGIKIGEGIAAFGYPLSGLLSSGGNFTVGNVSAVAGIDDDTRFIQISTPVQPGNSGGPVLDQSGNVVGMVTSKLNAIRVAEATHDVPQNVNFAIKATTLINFLDTNGVAYFTGAAGPNSSSAEVAEKAKSFSVLIRCGI